MRRGISLFGAVVCAATMLFPALIPPPARAAATVTQTFELRPGWNSVFLEVQPTDTDPAAVFAGVSVESVWTFFQATSSVQFIQNPEEGDWNRAAWGAYFTAADKTFLNNLYAVLSDRAYLVKVAGSEPVSWSITGTPTAGAIEWTADSFNLVGFRVGATAPTFQELLAPSPAHAGQAVYRIGDSGGWEFVDDPAAVRVRAGEAYWIYCEGSSEYQGALEIRLPGSDALDYGAQADTLTVALHNLSPQSLAVTVRPLDSDIDLAYRTLGSEDAFEWPPLTDMPLIELLPGAWHNLRIAVRRATLTAERAESAIEITDTQGTRLVVPVRVERGE